MDGRTLLAKTPIQAASTAKTPKPAKPAPAASKKTAAKKPDEIPTRK
jgi:hypothetical protein